MELKKYFSGFCFALMLVLTSCLGESNEHEQIYLSDAEIYSLTVQNDSIKPLSKADSTYFYIDQINGLIYNKDSVRYGTILTQKLVMKYAGPAGLLNITNVSEGDSTWISSGDSVDFSKPVYVRTYGIDGYTTKKYKIQLNIHQVDPDSMIYNKIGSNVDCLNSRETSTHLVNNVFYTYSKTAGGIKLHSSTDALTWTEESLSGLPNDINLKSIRNFNSGYFKYYTNTPDGRWYGSLDAKKWDGGNYDYPIIAILGSIKGSAIQKELLSCVINKNNKLIFATTPDLRNWYYGNEIPEDFPVVGFSSIPYASMLVERLTVVGGNSSGNKVLNTTWSTLDGLYWSRLSGEGDLFPCPALQGANVFFYNNIFYLLNGKYIDNSYNAVVYLSKDGGITWQKGPSKYSPPAGEYSFREDASVVVDSKNSIYIFGGHNSSILNEIWKGRINKLAPR